MIVAMAIVQGFKDTIKDKTFEFWGHFHVTASSPNNELLISAEAVNIPNSLEQNIKNSTNTTQVDRYVLGAGMLATDEYNEGVRIKGVDPQYFTGNKDNVITYNGAINYKDSNFSHDVMLSNTILARINKKVGDDVLLYILDKEESTPRVRKVKIAGTYHMGIEEIDNNFILCDIKLLQRIYDWQPTDITGLQVKIDDYKKADEIAEQIYFKYIQAPLTITYISDIYSEIFQWLELQDINAQIILSIMAIVAIINMITALLTYILERINMIGILKALGMNNWGIRKIFVHHFSRIILKGIFGGVILGLLLCWVQYQFKIVQIDETIYYMKYVPIKVVAWHVLGIIFGTFILSSIIIVILTLLIKKVNIIQAIKYK